MGKLFLLTSFLVITPVTLLFTILFLLYVSYHKNVSHLYASRTAHSSRPPVAYAALPPLQNISQEEITQTDARVELVRQFFARYKSPLETHAKDVVFYADLYGLDFRLIPAIAMQESNLCHKTPANSYNCWGYGIYGKQVRRFENYAEGIHQVTKTLATVYKKNGLETPAEIMSRYTPSSNGSWARSVSHFMNQLQ